MHPPLDALAPSPAAAQREADERKDERRHSKIERAAAVADAADARAPHLHSLDVREQRHNLPRARGVEAVEPGEHGERPGVKSVVLSNAMLLLPLITRRAWSSSHVAEVVEALRRSSIASKTLKQARNDEFCANEEEACMRERIWV